MKSLFIHSFTNLTIEEQLSVSFSLGYTPEFTRSTLSPQRVTVQLNLPPRVPGQEVKKRTKELSEFFRSYEPYGHKVGEVQEVLVTDVSHDKNFYVAHNQFYEQVLVPKETSYMGKMLTVRITSAGKFSMMGQPMDKPKMPGLAQPLKKGEVSGLLQAETKRVVPVPILMLLLAVVVRLLWIFL
ncbi:jg7866 [Pararge aegeria aegeria]|uniref:Jg7866 protein n=1 Tax=Pararge aegeria aegeria TaxID=348720 RepID=A0A8S4QWP3_9NEOP|nr:jg7866 [Pararge aegeria aegeria]